MMNDELISLGKREAQRLDEKNDHGAAIIMHELCERLRPRPGGITFHFDVRGDDAAAVERLKAALAEDRKNFERNVQAVVGRSRQNNPGAFA